MFRKFIFLIALSGCTVHQEERIRELLTVQQGTFPRVRDIAVVRESLDSPSGQFSLEIKPSSNGTLPLWILKGNEIPLQERFIFAIIDKVTGKIEPQYEFEAMEEGRLQIFGRNGTRFENEIPFVETRRFPAGSPIQYAVVSKERYTSAIAEFVPYPLETSGPSGEHLGVEVTHPMGTHFLLSGKGFASNEKLRLVHTSGKAREEIEMIADDQGSFSLPLNPTVFGRLGGEAQIEVASQGGAIKFDYPWGARLEKQAFEEKAMFPILFVVNRHPENIDLSLFFPGMLESRA